MKNLTSAALSHCAYWAIDATAGHALWRQLQATDAASHRAEFDRARASYMSEEAKPSKPYRLENGVAVLALSGVMTKAPTSMTYYGGGTATALLRWQIRKAVADEDVKSILLLVDSPGGSVAGTQDLADDIKAAGAKKPFDVYVEDQCCSAAYWAACGARKITANSTALIGSLGAMMAIVDSSDQAEMLGIKVLVYKTAELKGAGTPGTEITDTQSAMFQGIVDDFGAHFLAAIKAGRKFDDKKAAAIFNAEVFLADKALSLGLIDAIGSLDSVYADLAAEMELGSEDDCDASAAPATGNPRFGLTIAADGVTRKAIIGHHQTISATSGEHRPAAGAGKTTATKAAGAKNQMSLMDSITRALARNKQPELVTAVLNANSDEPEVVGSVIGEGIEKQVAARVASHPLILSLEGYGIKSVTDLEAAMKTRALGESYVAELRQDAKAEGTRLYGAEATSITAQVDHLEPMAVKSLRDSWRAEADKKFGVGADHGAKRQTAPATSAATAVDVDETEKPKRGWDRLTADQQAIARKVSGVDTTEKQDAYAANFFKEAA